MNTREVQAALSLLGYPLVVDGAMGPKTRTIVQTFQRGAGLAADGIVGPLTVAAIQAAVAKKEAAGQPRARELVPADWMPSAQLNRVIVHWTAGAHRASGLDRSHYHILIEGDGKLVRGFPSIDKNDARGVKPGYAAHTLNCNSGSIGVSLCCMAGAIESPFKAGSAPMTREQGEALPAVLADLCRRYAIPVTPSTVLSHAEVQGTLGIKQRGKWDISRLAFDPSVMGAKACGDLIRGSALALV
ncbi:putative peptidoglycan binding protein [Bosea sp. AK1]|uniref:peptidoglycan recognition protein family protein n=1 Tax=Bosea sp. AK1 TaxID=2587160 RepID=UPI00114E6D87|nr:N-acetylmuramoyl-L-alanine amidase [Bosea sp. AK1]TQI72886.1 putative peptidoglycan binding protein [Bosea sp. AK1]